MVVVLSDPFQDVGAQRIQQSGHTPGAGLKAENRECGAKRPAASM